MSLRQRRAFQQNGIHQFVWGLFRQGTINDETRDVVAQCDVDGSICYVVGGFFAICERSDMVVCRSICVLSLCFCCVVVRGLWNRDERRHVNVVAPVVNRL